MSAAVFTNIRLNYDISCHAKDVGLYHNFSHILQKGGGGPSDGRNCGLITADTAEFFTHSVNENLVMIPHS